MNDEQKLVQDLSDLTCTNLMIRLKILMKKTPPGSAIEFIIRRDQKDTIEVPFSQAGYGVRINRTDINRYQVELKKNDEGPEN